MAKWSPLVVAGSALLIIQSFAVPHPVLAQNLLSSEPTGVEYPAAEYYRGLDAYRAGELDVAAELFELALRGARRDVQGRWVDSIPSLAMLAECHWHLGSLPTAHEHLDHAFQITARSRGWLGQIDWQAMSGPASQVTRPQYLWPAAAAVGVLPLNRRAMYHSGQELTAERLARGGVIEERSIRSIDVSEILRGLAIANYRRRIILGQLSNDDPLADAVLESTKYPAGLQAQLPRALIGTVRAAGYYGSGQLDRAIKTAAEVQAVGGQAHPLSAIAMVVEGSAAASTENVEDRVAGLLAAVHVAGALQQPELIGEALQLAAGYAPPAQAAAVVTTAKTVATSLHRRSRLASLHCWIAGADAAVTVGEAATAAEMLDQAAALMTRRDVALPRLRAYAAYVSARIEAARGIPLGLGESNSLDSAITSMTAFTLNHRFRNQTLVSMPSAYQLSLVGQLIGTKHGGRSGAAVLDAFLDKAPLEMWRRDPVDALTAHLVDRSMLHTQRVNLAASEGHGDKLLIAADAMLADRFVQSLPLGGRVLQTRVLARLDDAALDQESITLRDQAGPRFKQLRAAAAIAGADRQQASQLEAQASSVALDRVVLPQVMPLPLNQKLPIAKLPARTALLVFVQVGPRMYGMLAAAGQVRMWPIATSGRLASEVGQLLRGIGVGHTRGNRLGDPDAWRAAGATLRKHLIPDDLALPDETLDALIVVPDGPLWYVPFELLPQADKDSALLGDALAVSYAATPALALQPNQSANRSGAIGVAPGPIFAPKDAELNAARVQSLIDVIEDPVTLAETSATPSSLLGDSIGHLVVAAPRIAVLNRPLTMTVAPFDQSSPDGTLLAWLRFPAVVPKSVILVGLRTPVDAGKMGNGHELFALLCAFKAAGVDSVLLSRWAVGGESTAILLRELLQELPFSDLPTAWKRARLVLRRSELDPAAEPLLTNADQQLENLTGQQPLFWSGYLVSAASPPREKAE